MQDFRPDIERMLQKAADEYPLREPNDRWLIIEQAVLSQPDREPPKWINAQNLTGFLMLLVLLLVGLYIGKQDKVPTIGTALTGNTLNIGTEQLSIPDDFVSKNYLTKQARSLTAISVNASFLSVKNFKTRKLFYGTHEKQIVLPGTINYTDIAEAVKPLIINDAPDHSITPFNYPRNEKPTWYYGITSGVEMNAVKNQRFSNGTFDVGVKVGYHLNNRFSIESGISMVRKYYTTNGKYFDMDEMSPGMPSDMEMMEVKGSSRIARIPLHLQVEWWQMGKNRLFSSHGFSSYILTEENNQYHVMMNGTEDMMYKSYSKDKNYFAATIDLGIGYERNVGGKNFLRIQPYLQLPLKGIGVGLLPVKSTGIHVGLIHNR